MQGKLPQYTPSQFEKIKIERVQQSGTESIEQGEKSMVIHLDFEVNQPQIIEKDQEQLDFSEVITIESITGEFSDTQFTKPEIS